MEHHHNQWIANDEGKDLPHSLPIKSKSEIHSVQLYQMAGSPPSCTTRAFLTFCEIPYQAIEVDFMTKKELIFSKYKKVPVITVNGLQINDSYIIIKTLTPIAFGRPLSDTEAAQLYETTYQGIPAFEVEVFGSNTNREAYSTKFFSAGILGCIVKVVASLLLMGIPDRIKSQHPNLQSFTSFGKAFKSKFSSTFMGGASPGPADVQLWGLVNLAKECNLAFIHEWLKDCGLTDWYDATTAQMPKPIF